MSGREYTYTKPDIKHVPITVNTTDEWEGSTLTPDQT